MEEEAAKAPPMDPPLFESEWTGPKVRRCILDRGSHFGFPTVKRILLKWGLHWDPPIDGNYRFRDSGAVQL